MSVKYLLEYCVLGMAYFLLNKSESQIVVLISQRKNSANYWIDNTPLRAVKLDDVSQSLNNLSILSTTVLSVVKGIAFLDKDVQYF